MAKQEYLDIIKTGRGQWWWQRVKLCDRLRHLLQDMVHLLYIGGCLHLLACTWAHEVDGCDWRRYSECAPEIKQRVVN